MARAAVLVLAAALFYVLLSWGTEMIDARFNPVTGEMAPWYEPVQGLLRTIAAVVPGLILGYGARQNGFLLGAIAGLLAGPAALWLVIDELGIWDVKLIPLMASQAVSCALLFGVASGAGELFGSKRKARPDLA